MEKKRLEQENIKITLAETASEELLTYGLWDKQTRIKRWLKKNVLHRQTITEDLIFWPTGLLAAGLQHCLIADNNTGKRCLSKETEEKIEQSLAAYFERWQKKGARITCLDDLLSGEVFLTAYQAYDNKSTLTAEELQKKKAYRTAIDKMAAYALSYPTDETGSFFYRSGQANEYIFADAIGQVCPFLYEYGRYFERKEYQEMAVRQIANFLAYGMDTKTGLPYHGYEMKSGIKYGIIGWGRAVGWLLRGMSGCMTMEEGRKQLAKPYKELLDNVLAYQRKDGYFAWQLQAIEGPADTSATGMICAALQEALAKESVAGEKYTQAYQNGKTAIGKSVKDGRVFDCSGECLGFSQYPQNYGAYPWALGPALLLE